MHVKDMFALNGKVAVVTGGSVGLGAQMATALAEAGAAVAIAARKYDRSVALCEKLVRDTGVRLFPVALDVSKAEDCRNLVDATMKEFGRLDILVNNAGTTWVADALDFPMDKWQRVMNLNVNGTFQLSVMAATIMKDQGGGKIVNMCSIGAFRGDFPENANSVAYTSSKGAVLTMTKDLAVKWAPYGITVNAICPGWFPTGLNDAHLRKMADKLLPRIPLGRYGGDEDLKGLVVFLASAALDYITGECIVIDGGQTALSLGQIFPLLFTLYYCTFVLSMPPKSATRENILAFLRTYKEENGYAPTLREIARACAVKSLSVVQFHLDRLELAGAIRRDKERSRSIILTGETSQYERVPILGTIAAGHPVSVPDADTRSTAAEWIRSPLFDHPGKERRHTVST